MINGVTILESIDIYQLSGWQILIGFIPLCLSTVIYFVRLVKAFKSGSKEDQANGLVILPAKELFLIFIGGLISLIFIIILDRNCPTEFVETQYEIKIEDSASFNEVYNNYIIVEEKEDTFIVAKKE